ncbi:hypothetical protein REPUB_Repub10bG0071500 [Reevesia pubescens]
MAASKALIFAKDLGLSKITLEGDALAIIRKLQSESDLSPIGNLIDEANHDMELFTQCGILL